MQDKYKSFIFIFFLQRMFCRRTYVITRPFQTMKQFTKSSALMYVWHPVILLQIFPPFVNCYTIWHPINLKYPFLNFQEAPRYLECMGIVQRICTLIKWINMTRIIFLRDTKIIIWLIRFAFLRGQGDILIGPSKCDNREPCSI